MKRRVATLPHPARVARVRALGLLLLLGAGASRDALACDSTGCLLVTRSASGLLPRKAFRLDLSYRSTDDSELMSGSDTTARVTRPKVDFENGIVRPGFHQDLGGHSRFLQVDAAYGLTARTTLLASAPVVTRRSYEVGHPPVLTENYETWGLGDTLVVARHSLVAGPELSVVVGAGLELPTGEYRLQSPEALFDIGVLDPMLQPGSGSWDVVGSVQASRRVSNEGTDLTRGLLLPGEHHERPRLQLRRRRGRQPRGRAPARLAPARLRAAQVDAPRPQHLPRRGRRVDGRHDRVRDPGLRRERPRPRLALSVPAGPGLPLRERDPGRSAHQPGGGAGEDVLK